MSAGSSATTGIRAFLETFIDKPFADDEDIFQAGFVDSLFAMQLVLFIENEFAFQITNEDLDLANFRSVDAMTALVLRASSR